MNKRIRKKREKIGNANRINQILEPIGELFNISSKRFLNGYFVFDHGENSVCHFGLKETPNWLYGIWLDKKSFQIFGEHEELIDKFKPSRTPISCENNIDEFIRRVKEVINNPKEEFVKSLMDTDRMTSKEMENEWDRFWDDVKDRKAQKLKAHNLNINYLKKLPEIYKEVEEVFIKDGNRNGSLSFPRYKVIVIVAKGSSFDREVELEEEIDKEIFRMIDSERFSTAVDKFRVYVGQPFPKKWRNKKTIMNGYRKIA